MRTSLNIDDRLIRAAKKDAEQNNRTLSETITRWARIGYETLRQRKPHRPVKLRPVDLGGPARVDVNSRRDWMDLLDE